MIFSLMYIFLVVNHEKKSKLWVKINSNSTAAYHIQWINRNVLKFICDQNTYHILLCAITTNMYDKIWNFIFAGFTIFARYVENSRVLQHSGYRFHKNRERKTCTHYICSGHNRYKCRAKVCTKMIDGIEMMKVKYDVHTHPPDETLFY